MRLYWILVIGFALFIPGVMVASSQDLYVEVLEDDTGDVVSEEYVEEIVSGYDGLDIIGMKVDEGLTEVTVTFTVKGNIILDDNYNYEFSAGDLDFEIWDGDVDISPSSASYTIVDGTITVTVPRADMDLEWMFIYGSAYYYDFSSMGGYIEDSIEDSMTRAGFSKEITDPEGDVTKMSMKETTVSDKQYLDIVKVTVTELENGDYQVVMELADDVSDSSSVSYSIDLDNAQVSYYGGSGYVYYYDSGESLDEVTVSGNKITAVLDGSEINDIDYIYATATEDNWETDESYLDTVSNDPWDDLDLEDLEDLDMEMLLEIDLLEEDEVEIRLKYRIGDGIFSDLMREDFDDDDDGQITQEEVDEFFDDTENSGEDIIDYMSAQIDGNEGTSTSGMEFSGIIGSVDSDEDIEVVMKITFKFDLDDVDTHDVEILIDEGESYEEEYYEEDYIYSESDYEESSFFGDPFFNITFRVILPDGWGIITDSLEPAFFLDFLNEGKTLIEASGEDIEDMDEPDDALISFTMEHDEEKYERVDVADDDDGNDSPIPGAFILSAALLIVVCIGILGSRRRK